MADPFQITLPQLKQFAKDQDTKNNILETNPGDKVKVVRPKTEGDAILDFFRSDLNTLGISIALSLIHISEPTRPY